MTDHEIKLLRFSIKTRLVTIQRLKSQGHDDTSPTVMKVMAKLKRDQDTLNRYTP